MAIEIRPLAPTSADAKAMIAELDDYLLAMYPLESNHLDSAEELSKPHVFLLGAFDRGQPLGCGAVKLLDDGYGELKRIYVNASARGNGIGGCILTALEALALHAGYTLLRLETGVLQPEALALFENSGYVRVNRFGTYPDDPLSVFMEKHLDQTAISVSTSNLM